MGESDILFAWHAFAFKFLSLGSHFSDRLFFQAVEALQRTLGYYHGPTHVLCSSQCSDSCLQNMYIIVLILEGCSRRPVFECGMYLITLCIW